MGELNKSEKERISLFIELSLSMLQKGFDEMDMSERLQLVKLFGSLCDIGIDKIYGRILDHERRIYDLEKRMKENDNRLIQEI